MAQKRLLGQKIGPGFLNRVLLTIIFAYFPCTKSLNLTFLRNNDTMRKKYMHQPCNTGNKHKCHANTHS